MCRYERILFFFFSKWREEKEWTHTWLEYLIAPKCINFKPKKCRDHTAKVIDVSLLYFFSACELPPFVLVFLYRLLLVYKHLYQRWLAVCQCVSCFSFFLKKRALDGRRWRGGNYLQSPQWTNSMRVSIIERGEKTHCTHIILLCLIWFSCSLFDPTSWRWLYILMKNIGVVRPLRALTSPATSYMHDNNVRHYSIGPARRENDNPSE